jgi:hypothetical protein
LGVAIIAPICPAPRTAPEVTSLFRLFFSFAVRSTNDFFGFVTLFEVESSKRSAKNFTRARLSPHPSPPITTFELDAACEGGFFVQERILSECKTSL